MAIKGVSFQEEQRVSLSRDTAPDEEKTWFTLKPLDILVKSTITDASQSWTQSGEGMQMLIKAGARNIELVRAALIKIENFKDDKGNDIILEFVDRAIGGEVYKVLSVKSISYIPGPDIAELADKVIKVNQPTGDLAKK